MKFLGIVLGIVLSTWASADEKSVNDLIAALKKIETLQGQFAQQTTDGKGKAQTLQVGNLWVKKPGFFRWDVKKPFPQQIISNNKTLWIYDPDLEQATKQSVDKQVGNTPAQLLSEDPKLIQKNFSVTQESIAANEIMFSLLPLGKDAVFNKVKIRFKDSQLQQFILWDNFGQKTDIKFLNIQTNKAIPETQFQFVPPKNTDVIDQA
jgi:outer membrane lipoprotein carrier protein